VNVRRRLAYRRNRIALVQEHLDKPGFDELVEPLNSHITLFDFSQYRLEVRCNLQLVINREHWNLDGRNPRFGNLRLRSPANDFSKVIGLQETDKIAHIQAI
jgi:hypothetical protein